MTAQTTWWPVLLEGVAGDVIGGLVAVGAVIATFRWERRREEERDVVAVCRELQSGVAAMHEKVMAGLPPVGTEARSLAQWDRAMEVRLWTTTADRMTSRLKTSEPCFVRTFIAVRNAVVEYYLVGRMGPTTDDGSREVFRDPQELYTALANAEEVLAQRLNGPAHFRRLSSSRCDEIVDQIKNNESVPLR